MGGKDQRGKSASKDGKPVINSRKAKLEEERNYELVVRKRRETGTFLKSFLRFIFSQVGMVVVVILVAIGGANIFVNLELPREKENYAAKREEAERVDDSTDYLSFVIWWYMKDTDTYNYSRPEFEEVVESRLYDYVSLVVNATVNYNYDGQVEGWDYDWTVPNALLFTISIMTVVGYGHIAPATLDGMLFCIIYSILAIMVFVAMLANVSSGIVSGITYTYSRCCCRWFRSERLKSEIPSRSMRKKLRRRLIDEEVGDEVYMPTNQIGIPIIVNIVLIFGYIFLGAMLFSSWEDWIFSDAIYFSFITLSTIGFGDLTPSQSFTGAKSGASVGEFMKMITATIYCSIGLAILSICLALIQEQIAKRATRAMNKDQEKVTMDCVLIIPERKDISTPSPEEIKADNFAYATSRSDEYEEEEEETVTYYVQPEEAEEEEEKKEGEEGEQEDEVEDLEAQGDGEERPEEEEEGEKSQAASRSGTAKSTKSTKSTKSAKSTRSDGGGGGDGGDGGDEE